jgi:hypothetical protein
MAPVYGAVPLASWCLQLLRVFDLEYLLRFPRGLLEVDALNMEAVMTPGFVAERSVVSLADRGARAFSAVDFLVRDELADRAVYPQDCPFFWKGAACAGPIQTCLFFCNFLAGCLPGCLELIGMFTLTG